MAMRGADLVSVMTGTIAEDIRPDIPLLPPPRKPECGMAAALGQPAIVLRLREG